MNDGLTVNTIDLDDLERKARAATPGPWSRCNANDGDCVCRTVWSRPLDDSPFCLAPTGPGETVRREDWDHVTANGPTTTLALIERIRELEIAAEAAAVIAVTIAGPDGPGVHSDNLNAIRALVARGTVTP